MPSVPTIAPCLWFEGDAEEAIDFYVSVFPNSRIDRKAPGAIDWPGGQAGDVLIIEFTLAGQAYQALNGGPNDAFNDRVSLSVLCEDQAEVDRYWEALTADGGKPIMCGWLQDKYGVRWQIVPRAFFEMMQDDDPAKSKRVTEAMMGMIKLDLAELEQAYAGG